MPTGGFAMADDPTVLVRHVRRLAGAERHLPDRVMAGKLTHWRQVGGGIGPYRLDLVGEAADEVRLSVVDERMRRWLSFLGQSWYDTAGGGTRPDAHGPMR
jgi:hypothetical protein